MHVSVREVHLSSDPGSIYFMRVDWSGRGLGSGFQVLLTDGQDAWRGDVSEAVVCEEATELEMQTERYIQDLQGALTDPDTFTYSSSSSSSSSYSFSLTPSPPNNSSYVTLAYEKVQDNISFRLGSVRLEPVPEPLVSVRELLSRSLQRGHTLQQHNYTLQQHNQRLRGEQQRISAELKRYAASKETLEAELYSRFVLVLNEKKAKIRSLQETLTHLQETRSPEKQKKGKSENSAADQEEDEYGGSTDEEQQEKEEEKEQEDETPEINSSTRASTSASPLDDSLKDITDVAPSRKRRFRHLGVPEPVVVKKPNPQRAEPPPGSSKPQTSRRSSDAAEATSAAEDLFDDF